MLPTSEFQKTRFQLQNLINTLLGIEVDEVGILQKQFPTVVPQSFAEGEPARLSPWYLFRDETFVKLMSTPAKILDPGGITGLTREWQ